MRPSRLRLISIFVVSAWVAGILVSGPSARGRATGARAQEVQAERQAQLFWNARVTKCGQDYYTKDRGYIHQFRNLAITVNSRFVSGADRLNGIQWRGSTKITVGQSRTYTQGHGWGRWSDGFTYEVGGVEVDAQMQRTRGQWSVVPTAGSQSARFKAIACSDVANPSGFFGRLASEYLSAEVRAYRDRAPQMGIYAHNIPDGMWEALYRCGNPGSGRATTIGYVYLAANGGWATCGRSGCMSASLPSPPRILGKWVEQATKDGGYVIFDQPGYAERPHRDFWVDRVPESLLNRMLDYDGQKLYVKIVRIGYNNEWFVLAAGGDTCDGCSEGDRWSWDGIPPSAVKALKEFEVRYRDFASNPARIEDVAFLPNSGFVILYGRNGFYSENVPDEVLKILSSLRSSNAEINQISFGPNDSWIIRANGTWNFGW